MSLEQRTKRELIDQHARLVSAVMRLWATSGRRMEDWRDPLSAVLEIDASMDRERRGA